MKKLRFGLVAAAVACSAFRPGRGALAQAPEAQGTQRCLQQFDLARDYPNVKKKIAAIGRTRKSVDIRELYASVIRHSECSAITDRDPGRCALAAQLEKVNTPEANQKRCAEMLAYVGAWKDINEGRRPPPAFCRKLAAPGVDPDGVCARLVDLWRRRDPALCAKMRGLANKQKCAETFKRIAAPSFRRAPQERFPDAFNALVVYHLWRGSQPSCDDLPIRSGDFYLANLARGACEAVFDRDGCSRAAAPVRAFYCSPD